MKTYRPDHPDDYLKARPRERWRCDIVSGDGMDHHGVGATPDEAEANARNALEVWETFR